VSRENVTSGTMWENRVGLLWGGPPRSSLVYLRHDRDGSGWLVGVGDVLAQRSQALSFVTLALEAVG
jgi:hypothetical protein